jgi:hypothetical protein
MNTSISNLKHLCTLLLTALAFAACSSDDDVTQEPVQPVKGDITFTAVFGVKNATTRALTDPGNGTLTASWQQGEQIAIIFGGNKYVATVTAVDSEGSATVSATLPSGTPNNQAVTYIYPASAADGSGVLSDLLSSQDGTLATLSSTLDVATAEGTIVIDGTSAQPNGSVTLVNQFAVCKFQFKDENNQAITDITKLTITDLATTEVITVTASPSLSAVYVAMKPSNNSTKFKVETYNGSVYKKTASANLQAGLFYHPTLQVTFSLDNSGIINGRAYVDLGLPSGTLWATCNVGANSPEGYGNYYACGETEPKSTYTWSNYKYCNGTERTLTKYCTNSNYGNNGYNNGPTELEAEDDAATANWDSNWQMPSRDQLQELFNRDYTTTEWTTLNGVNGMRITSKSNDNSIFLPAAGYYNESGGIQVGTGGYYWSRSCCALYGISAGLLAFSSGYFNAYNVTSYYQGQSVRPVCKQ